MAILQVLAKILQLDEPLGSETLISEDNFDLVLKGGSYADV